MALISVIPTAINFAWCVTIPSDSRPNWVDEPYAEIVAKRFESMHLHALLCASLISQFLTAVTSRRGIASALINQ